MKKNGGLHMVLRSHVKKKLIPTLPNEIIFDILVLLPAHILYAVMRYVCRQWNLIINDPFFVTTHLRRSTSIFLLMDPLYRAHFFHVTETHIKFSDVKFQFPGLVLDTCNGLTLLRDRRYHTTHRLCYIANPATNRIITLPPMPLNDYLCCLAFAASSNTYKVVVVTKGRGKYYSNYQCAILTVNVDRAWRLINCAHIGMEFMSNFGCLATVTSGFVYWGWGDGRLPCMLALNIDSESIKTILCPQMRRLSNCVEAYFRSKGNTISLIHVYMDYAIKMWVLKDHESEDWVYFPDLKVEELRREVTNLLSLNHVDIRWLSQLFPISWSANEEKILFQVLSVSNSLLVYDVKTGGTFSFIIDIDGLDMRGVIRNRGLFSMAIFPYSSSLTWVSGY